MRDERPVRRNLEADFCKIEENGVWSSDEGDECGSETDLDEEGCHLGCDISIKNEQGESEVKVEIL